MVTLQRTRPNPSDAEWARIVDELTRRGFLAGGAALGLLVGCGGGQPVAGPASSTPAGDFPVRVEHLFGTTEIPRAPQRVVALSTTDTDAAPALGVPPVLAPAAYGAESGVPAPWLAEVIDGADVRVLGTPGGDQGGSDLPFEQIAAVGPDVILGMNSGIASTPPRPVSACPSSPARFGTEHPAVRGGQRHGADPRATAARDRGRHRGGRRTQRRRPARRDQRDLGPAGPAAARRLRGAARRREAGRPGLRADHRAHAGPDPRRLPHRGRVRRGDTRGHRAHRVDPAHRTGRLARRSGLRPVQAGRVFPLAWADARDYPTAMLTSTPSKASSSGSDPITRRARRDPPDKPVAATQLFAKLRVRARYSTDRA